MLRFKFRQPYKRRYFLGSRARLPDQVDERGSMAPKDLPPKI